MAAYYYWTTNFWGESLLDGGTCHPASVRVYFVLQIKTFKWHTQLLVLHSLPGKTSPQSTHTPQFYATPKVCSASLWWRWKSVDYGLGHPASIGVFHLSYSKHLTTTRKLICHAQLTKRDLTKPTCGWSRVSRNNQTGYSLTYREYILSM